jgi:hypothetical protein
MDDMDSLLGNDLGDCLDDIVMGYDGKPRRARNPELGKFSLGRLAAGVVTGGVSEIARSRVGRAALTGGASEIARAGKKLLTGKKSPVKAVAKVTGSVKAAASTALKKIAPAAALAAPVLAAKAKAPKAVVSAALPEIRIRVVPCDGPAASAQSTVAKEVAAKIGPEMAKVKAVLDKMQLQNTVTSEHNAIKKRNKFQKSVLQRLANIQAKRACMGG